MTWRIRGVCLGYYRGISTPAPREFLSAQTDVETSDSFEVGVRHYGETVQAELVGFFSDFSDSIVRDNIGGFGSLDDANAGSAEVAGVEFAVRWDPLASRNTDWRLPLRASATYTHAEVTSNSPLGCGVDLQRSRGWESPTLCSDTLAASAGVGLEYHGWGVYVDATYSGEMYGTASNSTQLRDSTGTPDARYGKMDAALLVDLSMSYQVNPKLRFIAGISNLTGEEAITSRLPYGARSNQPRTFFVGWRSASRCRPFWIDWVGMPQ